MIIPTNQGVRWSRIFLNNSKEGDVYLDSGRTFKHIPVPISTFEIANLKMCSEYDVRIQFISRMSRIRLSDFITQKFWMTNNSFTADINENIVLSWTTSMTDFFMVKSPKNVIYHVQGYTIISNYKMEKYIFDEMSKDLSAINITVIRVNKTDAGLYSSGNDWRVDMVDGCCLLIVTSKPINTTLTLQPEHPFVGDNITFTCSSTIQRWPEGYGTSHLSYQFHGNTRRATYNNKLQMHKLTKFDKGTKIKCQATDDLGKSSNMSNSVTLDPYYGPDNVVVEPAITIINVTEGTALGPLHCVATCNPECKYNWKQNWAGIFKPVPNEFISSNNRSVLVLAIKRNQAGIYRCRVDHPEAYGVKNTKDISVNVQYSPKITDIWFSSNNQRNGVRSPTTFNFNEEVNVKMTLRVESNPDPQIMFKSSLLKMQPINKGNGYIEYISNLPSLKCEDSGNFTILASNGIPYADTRTVNLKICCKPRNATTKPRKIGAKINAVENIIFHVISFPAPTVEWDSQTGFDWTILKETYGYKHTISSKIHIGSEEDFGVYGMKICNQLGCINEYITLIPQDMPEAPENVSVGRTTFRSVNLSWIAGFNGGHRQNFSVQFKTVDDDKWDTRFVITNDIRTGSTVYYTLDQLKPDTSYQVMVLSTNKYGKMNSSLEFKTKDMPEAPNHFSVGYITDRSVIISWIAGFNGGEPQTFFLQFKTSDDDKWNTRIVHTNDTGTGSTVYYTLDQLKLNTRYHVMVFSRNTYGHRNASFEFRTKVDLTGKSTSISTLSIVLTCGYPVLFAVIILLVFINRRNEGSKSGSNKKNEQLTKSDEYTVIQRSNPTFTDAYSTLQSPTESKALQADSMETDTYDECGVLADVEVYQTMDNQKSGHIEDEQGSGQEQTKEGVYDNMKI
ncbi:unnamed protein product [Mytilus coruscus]|uniref:Uncharacterized protein n=1 Tax=Mytilus coruscus TaxID=42192 RepID=A0A6J8D643_MYTCO|nr:unnamed protein product [Mytilus coruscus]